jgi:hypothetical protein
MTEHIVDSLVANEFSVELDGAAVDGVFRVSGLTLFKTTVDAPLIVIKMVQRNSSEPFNKWLKDTLNAVGKVPTRNVSVTAVDDGTPTRRWMFNDAHIASVTYSDFDTASAEMMEERVVLNYGSVSHSWLVE